MFQVPVQSFIYNHFRKVFDDPMVRIFEYPELYIVHVGERRYRGELCSDGPLVIDFYLLDTTPDQQDFIIAVPLD